MSYWSLNKSVLIKVVYSHCAPCLSLLRLLAAPLSIGLMIIKRIEKMILITTATTFLCAQILLPESLQQKETSNNRQLLYRWAEKMHNPKFKKQINKKDVVTSDVWNLKCKHVSGLVHRCFWQKFACKVLGCVCMILSFASCDLQGWELGTPARISFSQNVFFISFPFSPPFTF